VYVEKRRASRISDAQMHALAAGGPQERVGARPFQDGPGVYSTWSIIRSGLLLHMSTFSAYKAEGVAHLPSYSACLRIVPQQKFHHNEHFREGEVILFPFFNHPKITFNNIIQTL